MFLKSDINWKQLFEASAAEVGWAAADRPVLQWRYMILLNLENATTMKVFKSNAKGSCTHKL